MESPQRIVGYIFSQDFNEDNLKETNRGQSRSKPHATAI